MRQGRYSRNSFRKIEKCVPPPKNPEDAATIHSIFSKYMKYHFHIITIIIATIVAAIPSYASSAPPPNVVLIMVDDMGINDIGAYTYPSKVNPHPGAGPTPIAYPEFAPLPPPNVAKNLTPNIDSLATQGLKMTSFYASSPVCTPSRASLLTGSYATRVRMENVILPLSNVYGMHSEEVTLAERLKQRGYRTAITGKWHLGDSIDFNPLRHGFDEFFGITPSNDVWPQNTYFAALGASPLKLYDGEAAMAANYTTATGGLITTPIDTDSEQSYLLEALTERSLKFIESSHSSNQPFFLYFAAHAPHVPCLPHPNFNNASGISKYYDVMMELDHRVGLILAKLDALGIAGNTLVIFTSDNGPWHTRPGQADAQQASGSAYPYRGHKRLMQEGGPRVPLLAKFPGKITAGSVTDEIGSNIDLFPTILKLTESVFPTDRIIDGVDLWPLWSGTSATLARDYFYYNEGTTNAEGIRRGPWKLINGALYNLITDPQENTNVAASNANQVSSLASRLNTWNSSMSRRVRGLAQNNQIEISADRINIPSGGTATIRIRLAQAANATVTIARFSGNTDVAVAGATSLTFTTSNFSQWQTTTLNAPPGASKIGGTTFRASSGTLHLREFFTFVGSPLPSTLLAHWPLNDGTPTIREQLTQTQSANLPAGTSWGTTSPAAPASTQYLQFNGSHPINSLNTNVSGAALGGSGAKTFVAWVKADAAGGTILSYSPVSGSQAGKSLRLLVASDGKLRAELNSAFLKSKELSLVGQGWRMVAVVFDTNRDSSRLYISGTGLRSGPSLDFGGAGGNLAIATSGTAEPGFSQNITIGNSETNTPFTGGIDMVSVYTSALNEQQLDYLFSQGSITALQAFRSDQILAGDGSQDIESPANDGVENLLKFAFNMIGPDHGQTDNVTIPNFKIVTENGNSGLPSVNMPATDQFNLTYIRRKAATHTGIIYSAEFSEDLVTWVVDSSASESVTPVDATIERVVVSTNANPFPIKRFVRVRVSAY